MKKLALLLAVILLVGIFAGCEIEEPRGGVPQGPLIENADGTLTNWMKEKIMDDYADWYFNLYGQKAYLKDLETWRDEGNEDGARYYGTYQDYIVLYLYAGINVGDGGFRPSGGYSYYVGPWRFVDISGDVFCLFAYKNGEFCKVVDLYEQGVFGDTIMEELLQIHNEFEQNW